MIHPTTCALCSQTATFSLCPICAFLKRVLPWLMEGRNPRLSNGYTHLFEFDNPPGGGGYSERPSIGPP
jgi:hypothetical protein